ncbi:MAG: DEAD/DEAH box helicase [Mogibacterium sp.]|uniref:DEAD/DEAH box helicase n=1 Tax=Mogibacterium sp. TaxID=2049035 RepID=UPI001A46B559|nr:DEAD/DEAH box helicase [Mogibacterium sp.]MBL6467932.1 DEAD/DEAH box helicase [Mogibacterium sp.]
MIPSILAKQLQKGIGDYIETTFPMTNEPFKGSLEKMLANKGSVYHEPYVAVRLPFRLATEMPTCFEAIHPVYLPYVHQQKAFERLTGDDGRSTLVATGTGSGKTECFLYPILEYCYQHRGERGIKALIIYPMNALATDQAKRVAELIHGSDELRGNVSVGMYVGGQEEAPARTMSENGVITDHETLLNNAPDILMTNYKMLDYLLVRPKDALLWQDNDPETLKYIAVDELHTFDGAQGTDLACLLRRLKRRLGIYDGFLCCVGTSATMGSKGNNSSILSYAEEIFGEPFEKDAIITEDRLSAQEFFAGAEVTEFTLPTVAQAIELESLSEEDEPTAYLQSAVKDWFPNFSFDVLGDEGRIQLGNELMHHSFMQSVINLTGGTYYQVSRIAEELAVHYPELKTLPDATVVINSLFALISHARTGRTGKLRPFLNVQVQLWMRELRRLVAKVDPDEITYAIAHDLNKQQAKQYLPVVNCRDCGITGWVSVLNERNNATMTNLESFYNLYFRADEKIVMMFPHFHDESFSGMISAKICPDCLQVKLGEDWGDECINCGVEMVDIMIPNPIKTTGSKHKQYVCPCCGSRRGISLMGVRSATEISASISQMFASKFNDDKKTLAFSDNVQDAAHRAGFFNSRTWRFGLRTAIQKYCAEKGTGQNLAEFQNGFIRYWHEHMTDEQFVSFFIAPNLTWKQAYEDMVEKRSLGKDKQAQILVFEVEQRIKYEIMLEFGLAGKIGRTLEKSNCSVLSFATEDIIQIADAVQERTINELGVLTDENSDSFKRMVIGYLNLMRINGAFEDKMFDEYTTGDGNGYMLSNDRNRWLPGRQSGRNTPRFIAERIDNGRLSFEFDSPAANKYVDWLASCCNELMVDDSNFWAISRFILDEAVKLNVISRVPSSVNYKIYGLNKEHVFVTDDVMQMRCNKCGSVYAVAAEDAEFWIGAPCQRTTCGGILEKYDTGEINYYGRLYSAGDLVRINAREHTGLLERSNREQLETDFKRGKDTQALWDPNVLSCTPTLEMGIDIGDLSTVILCSMPPAQSQFLQRAGRAGRKDGNSLTLAVANARPHDLYFYSDPLDMIAGDITPPKIFLRASAVLERQFVAFCMDSWVKKGIPDGAIPDKVGIVLKKLDARPDDMFPFNFLNYVQSTLSRQLNSFMQMFAAYLDDSAREELQLFARGKDTDDSPMYVKILDAFEELKKQQDALRTSVEALKAMIRDLEDKPKDSSYDEEIKELKREEAALLTVLQEIGKKNIFNFLSDEGLLPNYAFPEAGIILRAVLYRKENEEAPMQKKKYEKMVYEYSRSASSAISEFAPNNSFYVDGRKLTIDQVDLTTAQTARWRLCPNCSHAQIEEIGKNTSVCPQCGSPAWADAGQVRTMLKVQMVYSNMDYTKSMINDESDDRNNVFYCKQLLVDVDEDHDISSAYRMDNEDFPFGYEFVRKATLREINFGESDMTGEKLSVSGVEEVRKGFRICKYCGKIQYEGRKANHSFACKTRKMPTLMQADAYEECLFLYREFSTEILRLLVPATTLDSSSVKMESFVAAFMLGMKEYFGNVDHLRATVSEVPVPEADYRKQYLVIYDSVPGGTGYLKQLMHEKNALIEIFEKALHVMENCSCKDDPQKDGCYHCLYAYRQSQQIGNISRTTAIRILKSILSGKDNVQKIDKINDIPINPLFDSELEQRFMEAIRTKVGAGNVSDTIRNGKHSYYVKIENYAWEIEPQVLLDAGSGVSVTCKPDFVFWPVSAPGHKPVAVFTDGFLYHKDIVSDDTIKREAIRRSGNFRVWSLSFKDVQSVLFAPQGDFYTATLEAEKMPSGKMMYQNMIKKQKADAIEPAKLSSFDLLLEYLKLPEAESVFKGQACAYSLSLLEPAQMNNNLAFNNWETSVKAVKDQTHFTNVDFTFPGTIFGSWIPRSSNAHLTIHSGILAAELKKEGAVAVCAVLNDEKDCRTDKYEQEWNGFWRFNNLMQFAETFIAVSSVGISRMDYLALPAVCADSDVAAMMSEVDDAWSAIKELLFDDDAKKFVELAKDADVPAPDEDNVGYEVEGDDGDVIATVEIAWPDRRVGFMTAEQTVDKKKLEQVGWKILNLFDVADIDTASYFGGDN